MKKTISLGLLFVAALVSFGIGANPRYLEEIAWGGGYGANLGGWLEGALQEEVRVLLGKGDGLPAVASVVEAAEGLAPKDVGSLGHRQ